MPALLGDFQWDERRRCLVSFFASVASAGESFAMAAGPIATSSTFTSTPHPLHITSICIISTRTASIHIAYTRIPVTCTTSTSRHATSCVCPPDTIRGIHPHHFQGPHPSAHHPFTHLDWGSRLATVPGSSTLAHLKHRAR